MLNKMQEQAIAMSVQAIVDISRQKLRLLQQSRLLMQAVKAFPDAPQRWPLTPPWPATWLVERKLGWVGSVTRDNWSSARPSTTRTVPFPMAYQFESEENAALFAARVNGRAVSVVDVCTALGEAGAAATTMPPTEQPPEAGHDELHDARHAWQAGHDAEWPTMDEDGLVVLPEDFPLGPGGV